MPRPRSVTPERIARAALAVIDRDGLEGLSMRAVGQELGMGTMSLYRYVPDRGTLEGLVVDLVLGLVDPHLPAGAPRRQLVAMAERVRRVVGEHSAIIPLLLIHRHRSRASQQWGEVVLGVLTEVGFTGRRRVVAFRAYVSHIFGTLLTQHFSPLSGAGTAHLQMQSDFALLAATAGDASRVSRDREFRESLELLLDGFEAALRA
jgi:AcrR family transcriptional regulator